MNLGELLTPEQIIPELTGTGTHEAIRELVDHLEAHHFLDGFSKEEILDRLFQREAQVSTGIGSGVAIPHAFFENLNGVVAAFGRSRAGINFAALDQKPVFYVVLFIVPRAQYQLHLHTLAAIARMFAGPEIRMELDAASNREEILEVLCRRPSRN